MQGKRIKCITGMLVLVVITLFSGACKKPSYKSENYDEDPNFQHMLSQSARSAETVYFFGNMGSGLNDRIWYFDRKQMKARPLCGKAECTHEDSSCNADIAGSLGIGEALAFYGDMLFLAVDTINEGHVLYTMNPDGTERKILRKLSDVENPYYPDGNRRLIFHRGRVIVYGQKHEIVEGMPVFYHVVLSYELDSEKDAEIIYFEKVKDRQYHNLQVTAREDNLYINVCASSRINNAMEAEVTLYEYCLKDGRIGKLFDGRADCAVYEFWTNGVQFLYSSAEDGRVMEILPQENQIRERMNMDSFPGEFMAMYLTENAVVGFSFPNPDTIHIRIVDYDGKPLYDCTRDRMEYEYGGRIFCGMDEEYFYCNYTEFQSGKQRLVAYPLNAENPIVVW